VAFSRNYIARREKKCEKRAEASSAPGDVDRHLTVHRSVSVAQLMAWISGTNEDLRARGAQREERRRRQRRTLAGPGDAGAPSGAQTRTNRVVRVDAGDACLPAITPPMGRPT